MEGNPDLNQSMLSDDRHEEEEDHTETISSSFKEEPTEVLERMKELKASNEMI